MPDRALLIEYLRQRAELGDHELYLDTFTAEEFVQQLNAPASALKVLQEQAAACTACGLHAERTNSVFARGNPASPVVVVGEAPGEEEDRGACEERPHACRATNSLMRG